MRGHHVDSGAGIDALAVRERADPVPGPGQVLVAVRAAALSFRDLMVLRGTYVLPAEPDVVPVADGAGQVVAGAATSGRCGSESGWPAPSSPAGRTARSASSTSRSSAARWTACSPSSP
ncbi:alcohol dehydrogenase catalytic domain-containing protein [Streptomyces sp. NK08204]|uniref:alcohol dehydrogenase catalytic domain-containing protein n=1 Tax=Streptomyces sp. NK08204 TaxID=2873260 RepID=UPI0035A8D3E1